MRSEAKIGLCGFTMAMEDYPPISPSWSVQRTFYEPPSEPVMRRWLAAEAAGVRVHAQAWQLITHEARVPRTGV